MTASRGRPPTMADVAARAEVSHQTVSRVLNDMPGVHPRTAARVREAIAELGYRRNQSARLLASRRSGLIGVATWAMNQFGPQQVLLGLEGAAREAGYGLWLRTIRELGTNAALPTHTLSPPAASCSCTSSARTEPAANASA